MFEVMTLGWDRLEIVVYVIFLGLATIVVAFLKAGLDHKYKELSI